MPSEKLSLDRIHGFIFDLDGVLTKTAKQHSKAWKRMFDEFLKERSEKTKEKFEPFNDSDYRKYVDGKPRQDGVRDFLKSRKISLPEGNKDDPPGNETIYGLGNKKNNYFHEILDKEGPTVIQSSIDFIHDLKKKGIKLAVISSSKNCGRILKAANIEDLFETRVDGNDLEDSNMPGKPDPAMFLEAAKRLHVDPKESAIVEDSLAGLEAGRKGGFGLVVGMVHEGDEEELKKAGATVALSDLRKLEKLNSGY